MLYAFPERNGGITPILGPDGVFKKIDEFVASGKLNGFECDVVMVDGKPDHANATIYRTGDQKPAKYTAYFSEWNVGSNPNWQSRPRHMLWTRAIKQAARQVIHGLPMDADEYQIAQMTNVTPESEAPASQEPITRPEPPKRARKGAATVRENVQEAEVVPAASAATQEPAKEAPKTVEPVKQADPVAAPKTVEPAAPAATAPRAFLNDGEKIECEISVSEVGALNITTADGVKPSVKAKVKGGYVGELYHMGGGTAGPDGKAQVAAPWSVGASLKVVLYGRLNSKVKNEAGTGFGRVQVFVESASYADSEMSV